MAGRAGRAGQSDEGESFVIPADLGNGAGDKVARDAAARRVRDRGLPPSRASSQLLPPGDGDDEVNEASRVSPSSASRRELFGPERRVDLLMSTFAWSVPSHRPRLTAALKAALEHLAISGTWRPGGLGRIKKHGADPDPERRGAATRTAPTPAGARRIAALPLSHAVALHRDLSPWSARACSLADSPGKDVRWLTSSSSARRAGRCGRRPGAQPVRAPEVGRVVRRAGQEPGDRGTGRPSRGDARLP